MWRKFLIHKVFKSRKPDVGLEQMLDFAVNHVPYYRQFKGYRRLENFSFLTKQTIRTEFQNLLADDIDKHKWYYDTSGGSTGEPVRFAKDIVYSQLARWTMWETKRWAGYEPGQRLIKLWGSSSENAAYKRFKTKVALWILNTVFLDTFELSEAKIIKYLQIINRFRPRLVVGYASSLHNISQYAIGNSIGIKNVGAIVSSAGTLYPPMRQSIEEAFHCKVFNRYGSREVGIIAAEDGLGRGLKVTPTVYVEVVRDDGTLCNQGEVGEIVVTSLMNFVMPLIRYRIGDMGILKRYDGQVYLDKIVGRTVELFKTRDGRLIDGEYFTHLLYFKDWVRTFRFRQTDYDCIIIEIVLRSKDKPPRSQTIEVENDIKKMMGKDVRIDWRFVDAIKPLPSGKYVYTVSDIK